MAASNVAVVEKESAWQESISGFISGGTLTVTKTLVKYPLDTATVRLQMPNSQYSVLRPLELFEASYRGVIPPLIANVPAGGVFFAVKDATKASLAGMDMPRWARTFLAVAAAQFPYWLVRNPSEVVKTRQQAGMAGYGVGVSALQAYQQVREDTMASGSSRLQGLDGFYSGYTENILYAFPADVIKFVCYDYLSGGRKNLSPAEGAVAGAASTAVAQLLTTPLDVVRNRIMARSDATDESKSYIDALVDLGEREGISGLFAGATPRVGKAIVSGAIQFATYEETKQEIAKLFKKLG
jgi:Mitochondrial carrier protein